MRTLYLFSYELNYSGEYLTLLYILAADRSMTYRPQNKQFSEVVPRHSVANQRQSGSNTF